MKTSHKFYLILIILQLNATKICSQSNCSSETFWTINANEVQEWKLAFGVVSGGEVIAQSEGTTSLAWCSSDSTAYFYGENQNDIFQYNPMTETWEPAYTDLLELTNNGCYQNQHFALTPLGTPHLTGIVYLKNSNITLLDELVDTAKFVVFDLAVDANGMAWAFAGPVTTNESVAEQLRLYDSTGLVKTYSGDIPAGHVYGCAFINNILYLAIGQGNSTYPNSLLPIHLDFTNLTFEAGIPVPFPNMNFFDLASCYPESIEEPVPTHSVYSNKNILIAPNPVRNIIRIDTKNLNYSQLKIINSIGQIMFAKNKYSNIIELNISTWSDGIYFIQVDGGKGIKFLKQ